MDKALTKAILLVAIIAMASAGAYYYFNIYKRTVDSVNSGVDLLVNVITNGINSGHYEVRNLYLNNVKIQAINDADVRIRLYYSDLAFWNDFLSDLSDYITLDDLMTIYNLSVKYQLIVINNENGEFGGAYLTRDLVDQPLIEVIYLDSTVDNNEISSSIVYIYNNSLIILPKTQIYIKQNENNVDFIFVVPKIKVNCISGCESLKGNYYVSVDSSLYDVTAKPYEVSAPWIEGYNVNLSVAYNSDIMPLTSVQDVNILSMSLESNITISVQLKQIVITIIPGDYFG